MATKEPRVETPESVEEAAEILRKASDENLRVRMRGGGTKASWGNLPPEPADLEAFQRLRCAFDPDQLANPGKVMPTPRLCGEVPGPYRKHPLEQAGVAERF